MIFFVTLSYSNTLRDFFTAANLELIVLVFISSK